MRSYVTAQSDRVNSVSEQKRSHFRSAGRYGKGDFNVFDFRPFRVQYMPMYGGTDHYAVLGLNPSADDVVVHAAWKALLRKHHPDTNPNDPSGTRAREINEAFAVLGKPEARARYDRLRTRGPDMAPLRTPPQPYEGPRYRVPPRRRPSGTRLFGMALLIVATAPFAVTALLAFPATGAATRDALLSLSAGSPFAKDLVVRLDAVATGFTRDPPASAASLDSATNPIDGGNGEIATND